MTAARSFTSKSAPRQTSRRDSCRDKAAPPLEGWVREAQYAEQRSTPGALSIWLQLSASLSLPASRPVMIARQPSRTRNLSCNNAE
jgi:hypothetical protein